MAVDVLIIEDNEQNLYLMQFLLEKNGLSVEVARTGYDGIEQAIKLLPRVILLDIQLPEMDGYMVSYALRKCEGLRETPIVVVTSYAMPGDKEKALEAGASGYIEKPINPETFVVQIKKYIYEQPG